MKKQLNQIAYYSKNWITGLFICLSLLTFSCEPNQGRHDTESNQDFAGEENLPTSDPNDSTVNAGEVRADSTPAAHPDLDENPIIDKGMSTDSAWENDNNKKQNNK